MPFSRFYLIVLAVAAAALLTGPLRGPARQAVQPKAEPEPTADFNGVNQAAVDPALAPLLDRAIAGLREPRLSWLEAGVWLHAHLGELAFTAEGRHLRAPGQRFRLELHTRMDAGQAPLSDAPVEGTVLAVSDGRDLWSARRVGSEPWTGVTHLRTAEVLGGSAFQPVLRNEFLAGHALRGPELLLWNMQTHMEWVRREETAGGVRLTGRWKEWVRPSLKKADEKWPGMLPRYVRLTLTGADGWPSRVEYWGPREEDGPDRLLVEMEFKDAVLNRALPDEESGRLFSFDPGNAPVEDLTPQVQAAMTTRARELNLVQP